MRGLAQTEISKELLGLAGEYAVASELCRRQLYAQLTIGHHRKADILIEARRRMLTVQVKAKQRRAWPGVRGIADNDHDHFIVLVDFERRGEEDGPEFYVLNRHDWDRIVKKVKKRVPEIRVGPDGSVTYPDGWKGLNLTVEQVRSCQGRFDKITLRVGRA